MVASFWLPRYRLLWSAKRRPRPGWLAREKAGPRLDFVFFYIFKFF
jgi:hypothetical protein